MCRRSCVAFDSGPARRAATPIDRNPRLCGSVALWQRVHSLTARVCLRLAVLRLFTVFHLNLAYSSIEEAQRPEVVQRGYWPLLRLAERTGAPLGIEASAFTLETIAAIDPAWLETLGRLVAGGGCEFVGSGYAQVIGPLVPAAVNAA